MDNNNYYINEKKYKIDEYGYNQIYFYEINDDLIQKYIKGVEIEGMKSKDVVSCGILQMNKQEKIANIDSLGNYENKIKLVGGEPKDYNKKYNIILNGNQYYYNVERYSYVDEKDVKDDRFTFIDLITIKDKYKNNIHCGSIAIDTKTKKAIITSLGNSPKCLISNGNVEFKYGDILFQIMINICKKENVRQIELTDNSYRQCCSPSLDGNLATLGNLNLSLDFLKTMTHCFTHYYKYGFKYKYEPGNQILKENNEHFLTAPTIKANQILN